MWKGNLLACGTNAKTVKGDGSEYLTAIMYLIPWKTLGHNLCPSAELAACLGPCLVSAGRGQMSSVQAGRLRKTEWFIRDREGFMRQLAKDIASFVSYCEKRGIKPCVRLNGTSDVRWELQFIDGLSLMEMFPQVQFYDYTKIANRKVPANYHLTFSYSNANPKYAKQVQIALDRGMNIAVVWRHKDRIPASFLGLPTIDADRDDLRFLDSANGQQVVAALYAKGKAVRDTSGFVQD